MEINQNKKQAFTLVELIIVITILAILATIGFVSYQSYTTDARDANRVTSVKEISKGLDITYTKTSAYPMPDGTVSTGAINNTVYAYKGTIGDTVSQTLRMQKVVDPSSKEEYVYGINTDKTQYQIAISLENTVANTNKITESAYAAGGAMAKVMGNYKGVMKFSSGSETWIANIPSLLWNNSGSVNLMNTGTYFIVNKKTNLPYKINANTDLGTKNANTILQEITGTGVATLTGVNISNLTTSNFDAIFTGTILASFNMQGTSLTDTNVLKESVKSVVLGSSSTSASSILNNNLIINTALLNTGTIYSGAYIIAPNTLQFYTVGNTTITPPLGFTSVDVYLIGGGGASQSENCWSQAGAGGGFSYKNIPVDISKNFSIIVGKGGTISGESGGNTSFSHNGYVFSAGGGAGGIYNQSYSLGGCGIGGTINYCGGKGGYWGGDNAQGGGGGGAGYYGNGFDGKIGSSPAHHPKGAGGGGSNWNTGGGTGGGAGCNTSPNGTATNGAGVGGTAGCDTHVDAQSGGDATGIFSSAVSAYLKSGRGGGLFGGGGGAGWCTFATGAPGTVVIKFNP